MTNSGTQQWAPGTLAVANEQGQFEVVKGRFSVSGYPIEHLGTSIKDEMMIDFATGEFSISGPNQESISFSADMAKEAFLQKVNYTLLTELMECEGELFELSSEGTRFPGPLSAEQKLFETGGLELGTKDKFTLFIPTMNTPLETLLVIDITNRTENTNILLELPLSEVTSKIIDLSANNVTTGVDDYVINYISFKEPATLYSNIILFLIK